MKKQILIATGLAVLSTSAFATKARLEALGQTNERGSFYIEDNRNVFRNAAKINTHTNFLTTEWGTSENGITNTSAPNAEGGFFREAGSFNYGVYLGSDIGNQETARYNGGTNSYQSQDNDLDLFFGGDMGVQWGARLHWAKGKTETAGTFKKEHSNLGLGLGMVMGDIEAYANMILSDESKGGAAAGDKLEANGLNIGVAYDFAGNTFFVDYDKSGYDNTVSAAKTEYTDTSLTIGVGRIHEVSSTARINMDVAYNNSKAETKTTSTTEVTESTLPISIGFEADATSWLVFRGSVKQNVFLNGKETKTTTTNKETIKNSTAVNGGMTLNFGKLRIDGTVGTAGQGTLNTDTLLSKVGLTYHF